jgi:adenylylsulfate kinase
MSDDATETTSDHVYRQHGDLTRADREALHGHRGACLWLTGLSGSGKTSIAHRIEPMLHERGVHTYGLDGDNIRHGLNSDLGFSPEERDENIRRIGEVAKLFVDAGTIVIASFISPYREVRQNLRESMGEGDFIEVFVDCPVEICEERDPKGLYEKARSGEIENFTGISAPYEAPQSPDIHIDTTDDDGPEVSARRVVDYLADHDYLTLP